MDYEDILFGLQPLLTASTVEEILIQDASLENHLRVLDKLAGSLRSPSNRDIVGSSGLLSRLLKVLTQVLDASFHTEEKTTSWFKLASELIRCVANCVVDNNDNRLIFLNGEDLWERNEIMDYYIPKILQLTDLSDEELLPTLQMRTIVMVKNACLENDEYKKRFAKYIRNPLLKLLNATQHTYLHDSDLAVLGSELFCDLIQVYFPELSSQDLLIIAQFIQKVSKTLADQWKENAEGSDEEDEDPNVEIMTNLTQSLEDILRLSDTSLNYRATPQITSHIQNDLLSSLDNLSPKEFPNKLIAMRRITSSIGYISSNITNSNKKEQLMCFYIIQNSNNGYTLAAALIVLSNSISSRQDAETMLQEVPLGQLLIVAQKFKDPMQYQGFLDIFKKLLNLASAMTLSEDDLLSLSRVIKVCDDQSKYFQGLSPLIENLLKKLLSVLPNSSVQKLLCNTEMSPLLQIITDRGSLLSCLALDKLLTSRIKSPNDIMQMLWKSAFRFKDLESPQGASSVSVFYLFQLAKTTGLYLKECEINDVSISDNLLFANEITELESLLEALISLKDKTDKGSASAFNNGMFVAGIILNLLEKQDALTTGETKLQNLAKAFFKEDL